MEYFLQIKVELGKPRTCEIVLSLYFISIPKLTSWTKSDQLNCLGEGRIVASYDDTVVFGWNVFHIDNARDS